MTDYVVGFAFNPSLTQVVLIDKRRGPEGVRGRLNGVGGHIEPGETPAEAMRREFLEETGVATADWAPFATLRGDTFVVHVFKLVLPAVLFSACHATTDEQIHALPVHPLHPRAVRNLHFLIPLALVFDDPTLRDVVVQYAA